MAKLIPVTVEIQIGTPNGTEENADSRIFGSFEIAPYATPYEDYLEVSQWVLWEHGSVTEFYDKLLFSVFPRKLLSHICVTTFETERPFIQVQFIIGGETWTYQMRARELEYEQVHYQIKIDDEWQSLTEVYLGDVLTTEMLAVCEREVTPSIDFGHAESVLEMMR